MATRPPPTPFFCYQNRPIKSMRKPFSKKKSYANVFFYYSCAESQNQNMHQFKNIQKLNKKKRTEITPYMKGIGDNPFHYGIISALFKF